VIGTRKNAGLDVYDLGGRTVQSIPAAPGRLNNVDVLTGVKLGDKVSDLAVVTIAGLPLGLLVTHDGENTPDPDERASTNFKYTRLERVALALLLSPRQRERLA
jgi:3-phytase